jgi:hypothetical protein
VVEQSVPCDIVHIAFGSVALETGTVTGEQFERFFN